MSGEIRFPIVGNLTADPELKHTRQGVAVVTFTIASTPWEQDWQTGKGRDGEPVFMRCAAWRELGENVARSLSKGQRVIAFGRYRQRRYQTEDGEHRTAHEVEVEAIGPDLRWATVAVQRTTGRTAGAPASDVWHAPDEPGSADPFEEEQPF